jgi:diguanylate cyclase (GGDEF)-like protein
VQRFAAHRAARRVADGTIAIVVLSRIRRSVALKLILASAVPSAVVLLVGLGALIAYTEEVARTDPALAFHLLKQGAVIGSLLTLTFAGIAVAITSRKFLVKPAQQLGTTMARAELGDILVRAKVTTDDELGRLARSFNTMLARVTDMAAHEIENERSLQTMERELSLKRELTAVNERLEAHVREMELLLDVSKALTGTLDLPEQLEQLGRLVCDGLAVEEFCAMLLDEQTHQLVTEAVYGRGLATVRGMRFRLGEGVTGAAVAQGATIYVPDVQNEPRYLHYQGLRRATGSFLCVPLRAKGRIVGAMNLNRAAVNAFSPQEIRLAEAIAAQAGLAIANARLYQQTLELSYTDPLTGIPNRRHLFARLEQELSRSLRFGDELTVLMIDLDLFKQVNDAHGHGVGDAVLRGVAVALQRNVRKVDMVARYGGEEFVVVLPRIARDEAIEVAEKLRRAVAATPLAAAAGAAPLHVTISVGVASYGHEASDVAALIEKADVALYEAKHAGRNRVSSPPPVARAAS